jgi:hypothetical protein
VGQGVEGAQRRDSQAYVECGGAEAAEEQETHHQKVCRHGAHLLVANTSSREDVGDLVGVGEVGGQVGPVVEHEDVRHQAHVGDQEDRERTHLLRRRVAEREGGAEQRRPLEHEDLLQALPGQVPCRGSSRRHGDGRCVHVREPFGAGARR